MGRGSLRQARPRPANASISTFPPDLNIVREGFARFGLLDDRTIFLQGPPSQTLAEAPIVEVALLRVDSDDPEEVRDVLDAVYDRIVPGGFVVIDDYGNPECRAVVDGFRSQRGVAEPLERIDWSGAAWRKAREGPADARGLLASRAPPCGGQRHPGGDEGLGRGRRRLQHAPGGGEDAALALAQLSARHRRPRLRGDRGRERIRPRAAAGRGVRLQLRQGVPLHRSRAPRRRLRRPGRSIAASPHPRGGPWR